MGLAQCADPTTRARLALISKAENYLDRSGQCKAFGEDISRSRAYAHTDYEKIQDVRGECGMLAKKSMIARIRGDFALADNWVTKYITLCEKQLEQS